MFQKVLQARVRLAQTPRNFIAFLGSPECLQRENEYLHGLISIGNVEEKFLKQKSRNKWLSLAPE